MTERFPFDEQGLGLGSNSYDDDPLFGARPDQYAEPARPRYDPMTGERLYSPEEQEEAARQYAAELEAERQRKYAEQQEAERQYAAQQEAEREYAAQQEAARRYGAQQEAAQQEAERQYAAQQQAAEQQQAAAEQQQYEQLFADQQYPAQQRAAEQEAAQQNYHPDPQHASHEQYGYTAEPDYEPASIFQTDDDGYDDEPTSHTAGGGSRRRAKDTRKRPRGMGCLVAIVVLALVVAGGWFAVSKGMNALDSLFGEAADYPGPGSGKVMVEVKPGDSAAAIGRTLKSAGVVASVDAFIDAASGNPDAAGIQVGHYEMKKEMKASDALAVLINPKNVVANGVTIPEGFRVEQTIEKIAAETDFKEADLRKLVEKRSGLGLPEYAEGNPEGFLFPSTYDVGPDMTAADLLKAMVRKFKSEAGSTVAKASSVDLTEHELVILASIIEKEVRRPQDMPAVAEVVLNRLSGACSSQGVPDGRLQMDSTVHYIEGKNGSVFTTDEMRNSESEYNTYEHDGLPPGPIAAPSIAALKAALKPTDNGYCYFVAVNLKSGETLFAQSISDHEDNKAKLEEWCDENPKFDC